MDRRFFAIALVLAVLALIAVAAIGSGTDEKEKETPTTPETPDTPETPTTPETPDTPEVPEARHTESVVLDRAFMTMPIGQTLKVEATVTPSDSADRAEWSTSDRMVATVSQGGYVTARSEGTATITVESGGHSASLQVTVYKGVTQGERNAEQSARQYVGSMDFSEKGLFDQLLYEGFTEAEARYGVEHCGADWFAEALDSAKGYVGTMDFSEKGLFDQLVHDGFTESQARHGAQGCGADWYAEAEESARQYLESFPMSKEELYGQLVFEGFTEDQARKAVDKVYV